MHLQKVKIHNWGPIKKMNWEITDDNNMIILCGLPGIGKSSIIRALTYGLSNLFLGKVVFISYIDGNDDYSIEFEIEPNTQEDELFLKEKNYFFYPSYNYQIELRRSVFREFVPFATISPETFSHQYNLNYSFRISLNSREKPDILWYDPSKDSAKIDLRLFIANIVGFYLLDDKDKEIELIIDKINKFLLSFFNLQISIENSTVKYIDKSSKKLLESLYISTAEEYTIGTLFTIYACLKNNSILLLDSPESYLPPTILTQLIEIAKNELSEGQIIISTHSPSLISFDLQKKIYLLKSFKNYHKLIELQAIQNLELIKILYGSNVLNSIIKYIPTRQSSVILSYLLDCFFNPEAIQRKQGDTQIQQLALWLNGFFTLRKKVKTNFIDIGAGYGDLIEAIKLCNSSKLIHYIPIEPNKKYWSIITKRCNANEISHEKPIQSFKDYNFQEDCIVFMVNILHELDLKKRIDILYKAFKTIKEKGVLLIHEVAILPEGEANFFIWSIEDIISILNSTKCEFDFNYSKTITRPGGWPLETLCIKLKGKAPSKKELLKSIIDNLPQIKENWESKIDSEFNVSALLKDRYTAFLMAQIYNANVWINRYIKSMKTGHNNV